MSGILLMAGYGRAWHAAALAETLRIGGRKPAAILIAYPATLSRLRGILRSRGRSALLDYALRRNPNHSAPSPIREEAKALGLATASLAAWARRCNVPCHSVFDPNGARSLGLIGAIAPDVTVYTGGGLLGTPFLEACGRRVLNAHSGPLPEIRGMNACEWSLMLGYPPTVTLHWIDEGVDTGRIISRHPVVMQEHDAIETMRERCVITGVRALAGYLLADASHSELSGPPVKPSRQCFVMAPALRELLAVRLETASAADQT